MTTAPLTAQVVLSSWPWRTGTIIYDPVLGLEIAAWSLNDLQNNPEWVAIEPKLLDPRLPDEERGRGILAFLEADQPLLTTTYNMRAPEAEEVCLELSELPEEKLTDWLSGWELTTEDISLDNLDRLLETLEGWPIEKHHRFLSEWWEQFEIPHREGPSRFRLEAAPGEGTVYGSFEDQAEEVWRRETEEMDLSELCLWSALRVHYGWRLDFPNLPWPGIKGLAELNKLFPAA